MPQQRLLEITRGAVFHDPRGELAAVRDALAWYPDDVWYYVLACQWHRIGEEEAFVGRCAELARRRPPVLRRRDRRAPASLR